MTKIDDPTGFPKDGNGPLLEVLSAMALGFLVFIIVICILEFTGALKQIFAING